MAASAALKTFMYFAYGSNLLAERIHIANPSAVRRGIGKLQVSITYITKKISYNLNHLLSN